MVVAECVWKKGRGGEGGACVSICVHGAAGWRGARAALAALAARCVLVLVLDLDLRRGESVLDRVLARVDLHRLAPCVSQVQSLPREVILWAVPRAVPRAAQRAGGGWQERGSGWR